ncbi:MAG TPA: CPBP family intramembrane glutamic endopeptidase [Candidatus Thermoplasmatota archaeon]|nr:CPBP family intramembrane glutamic endopeptidase [Candidatus Thermoplasmatota archaeon]
MVTPYAGYWATAWLLALLSGGLARLMGQRPWRAAGLGLMTVPLWTTGIDIGLSIAPLVQGGTVLQAASRRALSDQAIGAILVNLGYLGAGFLVYATDGRVLSKDLRGLARELASVVPLWRNEGASAAAGLAVTPLLALGFTLLVMLTQGIRVLNNGDDSQYFTNMTLYHAVLISAAAALGEELLFRGLLQGLLARGLVGLGRGAATTVAIVLQAIVFGFAHAGYGNFSHVLFPAVFGLLAGFLSWRFGLWSAIVLHFLADFYQFGLEAGTQVAWVSWLVQALFLLNIAFSIVWVAAMWRRRRVRAGE